VLAALTLLTGLAGAVTGTLPATAVDAAAPVKLAIAVPLALPAGTTGLVGADDLAQYTSPLGLLTRELDAVFGQPVAIGIDPMIIASIRVLGSAAPESATAWLDRLSAAPNQTFALAYGDTDLTLATQAGAPIVPEPQSFDFAIDPAHFAPVTEETATPSPSPTADPANPVLPALPTTRTLLDWPYTLNGIAWPRDDSAVATDLTALEASGYTSTILSSANVARNGGTGSSVDVDGNKVLVSDGAVSAALRSAARALTDSDWLAAMATLTDAIAAAGRLHPAGSAEVFATMDRSVPFTGGRLGETLDQLALNGNLSADLLSSVMAEAGTPATVVDMPQPADRVALASPLFDAERAEQQFASVAKDPLAITAPRRIELLSLLANQWQSNLTGWPAAAENFLSESTTLTSSVQIVASSAINLLADRATLPIAVSNDLDQAVTVYISVRADTGLLAVESSRVKLVIEPNSQGKGQIPVQAISNGTVGLTMSLTSASGVPIGSQTRTEINVQAGWETPVVIVIGAFVVAMFAFGIVRSILRRRKRPND
jgi:hypothetical protein